MIPSSCGAPLSGDGEKAPLRFRKKGSFRFAKAMVMKMKIKVEKDQAVIDNTAGCVIALLLAAVILFLFVSILIDFTGNPKESAAPFIVSVFIILVCGCSALTDARFVWKVTVGEEGVRAYWIFRSKLVKWDEVIGYEYINANHGRGVMPTHVQIIWYYGAKRRKLKSPHIKHKLKTQYMEQIFQVCDRYFDVPGTEEKPEESPVQS